MNNAQLVTINLQHVEWTEFIEVGGGGGVQDTPSISPYLWTIFFKIDGETLQITSGGTLAGVATVQFTPGSHGDLNTRSVGVGTPIAIPAAIGQWSTVLQPIPVAPELQGVLGATFPATVGFLAVLMHEDHVSDSGAEAGHQALNQAVQEAIASLIASIGPSHPTITQQDIDNLTGKIPDTVKNAIINAQSILENLWTVSGPDQVIGFQVAKWSQSQFSSPTDLQPIAVTFGPDFNSWQIIGKIDVVDLCTTTSLKLTTSRQAATHCTRSAVVQGEPCTLNVKVLAPTMPSRTFDFTWGVTGADVTPNQPLNGPTLLVNVDNNATTIVVTVAANDNLGCSLTLNGTFPTLTVDMLAALDRICKLRDEIQSVLVHIPIVMLHPAGPDPGPEQRVRAVDRFLSMVETEMRVLEKAIGAGRALRGR